jgi:hypothetical protein
VEDIEHAIGENQGPREFRHPVERARVAELRFELRG